MKNQSKYNLISFSYFLYLLGYFSLLIGLNFISQTYVYYFKNIIEFVIAYILLYKFTFKQKSTLSHFDRNIIIISGWLLLSNTVFVAILQLEGQQLIEYIYK